MYKSNGKRYKNIVSGFGGNSGKKMLLRIMVLDKFAVFFINILY